jgi:hypothetical protein
MALFTRVIAGLQGLFPASGGTRHSPSELSDNVQLVHPFPSQAADLDGARVVEFISAASVTPVLVIPPAAGNDPGNGPPLVNSQQYDEWVLGDVRHTAAGGANPILSLSLNASGGLTTKIGVWSWDDAQAYAGIVPLYVEGIVVGGGLTVAAVPKRPIIVPPGWTIIFQGNTQAVAYDVRIRILVIRRFMADVPLFR